VIGEAGTFAESVATAADRALAEPEPWRPGAVQDDRSPALAGALAEIGWLELGREPELLPLVGPAALELGRRLAPLSEIDALLGGSPLAGDLTPYGAAHAIATAPHAVAGRRRGAPYAVAAPGAAPHPVARPSPDTGGAGRALARYAIDRAEPVPYGDALGVHRVLERHAAGDVPAPALAAWTAATTGYLAGLSEWALEVALEHARGRRAFGTTLAGLAPVQQGLADAATAARGLRLLASDAPGRAALAHAGAAAVAVTAACQQIAGAIGFTLEFPLQRAYRRARAVQLWADALIAPSR
jgi:hypothetical protein